MYYSTIPICMILMNCTAFHYEITSVRAHNTSRNSLINFTKWAVVVLFGNHFLFLLLLRRFTSVINIESKISNTRCYNKPEIQKSPLIFFKTDSHTVSKYHLGVENPRFDILLPAAAVLSLKPARIRSLYTRFFFHFLIFFFYLFLFYFFYICIFLLVF